MFMPPSYSHVNCLDSSSRWLGSGTHGLFDYVKTSILPALHTIAMGKTADIENPDGKPWEAGPLDLDFWSLCILIFRSTQKGPGLTFPSSLMEHFLPFMECSCTPVPTKKDPLTSIQETLAPSFLFSQFSLTR